MPPTTSLPMIECAVTDLPESLAQSFRALTRPCKILLIAVPDLSGQALGKQGAKARAAKLTPTRRTEIAQQAARARWRKPTTASLP